MPGSRNQRCGQWHGLEALESRLVLAANFSAGFPLTDTDPISGNMATFSIVGPGTGSLTQNGTDSAWDLTLSGTDRTTIVKITALAGTVDLQSVTASSMVGRLRAPNVDFWAVAGHENLAQMTFARGLLGLVMHDSNATTSGAHALTVAAADFATDALALTFNNINDLAVLSRMPIASVNAAAWLGHTAASSGIFTTKVCSSFSVTSSSAIRLFFVQRDRFSELR